MQDLLVCITSVHKIVELLHLLQKVWEPKNTGPNFTIIRQRDSSLRLPPLILIRGQ